MRVNGSATADLIKTTKKGIYDVTRGEYVTEGLIKEIEIREKQNTNCLLFFISLDRIVKRGKYGQIFN